MRFTLLLLAAALACAAAPRIDNVLVRMVPPGSTALLGAHMDAIRQTGVYKKMIAGRELPNLDDFAAKTGFDPRRDVRELLYVTTPGGAGVLLARGNFHPNGSIARDFHPIRHGEYKIYVDRDGKAGFCILDSTLAAAGELPGIEAALNEWKSGAHTGAQPLLAIAAPVSPSAQIWGVSKGVPAFISGYSPPAQKSLDFSKLLRGVEFVWFEADLTAGLHASVHGETATDRDAAQIRDTLKGLVAIGRLSVPENRPELLRLWDAIAVSQDGRAVTLKADIPENLIDEFLSLFESQAPRRGAR